MTNAASNGVLVYGVGFAIVVRDLDSYCRLRDMVDTKRRDSEKMMRRAGL
jgi:hypothetical protein